MSSRVRKAFHSDKRFEQDRALALIAKRALAMAFIPDLDSYSASKWLPLDASEHRGAAFYECENLNRALEKHYMYEY